MNNKTILRQSTIDFCNKWKVEVKRSTFSDLEKVFKNKKDSFGNECFKSPFGMHGILWNKSTRIIVVNDISLETKRKDIKNIQILNQDVNRIVLHELAHCLMNEKPDVIIDFASPLYTLDRMFLRYKNIEFEHPEFHVEKVIAMEGGFEMSKTNNIKDYFNYFENELIKMHVLDASKEFTYKSLTF